MNSKRFIKLSKDGYEKQLTYRELNKRRNQAQRNGNYVEMITFEYAMIEDRLLSILKHLNIVIIIKDKPTINNNLRDSFYIMYYKNDDEHEDPKLYNISTKIKIIDLIFKYNGDDLYFSTLSKVMKEIDMDININKLFKRLNKWLPKRNEIIHGMYNKNIDDFDKNINDIAIEGKEVSYEISRLCDSIKKKIKNI